jgi:hypothetical protein
MVPRSRPEASVELEAEPYRGSLMTVAHLRPGPNPLRSRTRSVGIGADEGRFKKGGHGRTQHDRLDSLYTRE